MVISQALIDAAKEELKQIATNATKTEWSKLRNNLHILDGNRTARCVYGLLTGHCNSIRARQLIQICSSGGFFKSCQNLATRVNERSIHGKGYLVGYTNLEVVLYWTPWVVKQWIREIQ